MSYAKLTDFAVKDALLSGNPAKVIRGVEFDAEFNAIVDADALNTKASTLSASSGSSVIGFLPAGTGAAATTVQAKLRESVSVVDFGASTGATAAANVTAFQAALNYANSINGCKVVVPKGTYLLNAALLIYKNTTLVGEGRTNTTLSFSHAGDGIQSTWPINSSTAVNIVLRDINIECTNGANTGGGFADVGGTFLELTNVRLKGWKYNTILDQSEIVQIDNCDFESWLNAGIWMVNGPAHTVGANFTFTNRISVTRCQFNAGNIGYCIADDGGGNHYIVGNNFNGGNIQYAGCAVGSLTFQNNECEGGFSTLAPIQIGRATIGGTVVTGCQAFNISDNGIGGSDYCIYLFDAHNGSIENNQVFNYSTAAFAFDPAQVGNISGVSVRSNNKLISVAGRTYFPFFPLSQALEWNKQGDINQLEQYYVASALAATGSQVITLNWIDGIAPGSVLLASNADGTNSEKVRVTATSGFTFTATFTSTKSANWVVRVVSQGWLPVMSGSSTNTPESWTYTTQQASYQLIGNRVYFDASVVWTAAGGTGQLKMTLPVAALNVSGKFPVFSVALGGAAGVLTGYPSCSPTPGAASVGLTAYNPATGAVTSITSYATGSAYVSGSYEV